MPDFLTSDLALNLYAEGIGIAVTVALVARVLEWREIRRWLPATRLVYERLIVATNGLCANVRERLGIRIEEFEYRPNREPPTSLEGSQIVADRLREWITSRRDEMAAIVARWDNEAWNYYAKAAKEARTELLNVMSMYGGRLDNGIVGAALQLLESLDGFRRGFDLFPGIWGMSPAEIREEHPSAVTGVIAGMRITLARNIVEITARTIALKDVLHSRW